MRLVGELHPNSKLTNEDVRLIRELAKMGVSRKVLSQNFNISMWNVKSIIERKTWTHI